jgi:hypothetical protein
MTARRNIKCSILVEFGKVEKWRIAAGNCISTNKNNSIAKSRSEIETYHQ